MYLILKTFLLVRSLYFGVFGTKLEVIDGEEENLMEGNIGNFVPVLPASVPSVATPPQSRFVIHVRP